MNVLNKELVVKLNKHWQAFETLTVGEAITFLCSESNGNVPGYVMDYETVVDEKGTRTLTYSVPVTWDDWIKLPVREQDLYINTSRGKIRMPKVVITAHYCDVPTVAPRFSPGNVLARDNYTCQYTGRKLPKSQLNVDHVLARDRGGRDVWENVVACDKNLNSLKGNRLNEELGIKPIRAPKAPMARKKIIRKCQAPLPDQTPFLVD
jgi:5-methylcytosine-specific restriction endonuclease McrA